MSESAVVACPVCYRQILIIRRNQANARMIQNSRQAKPNKNTISNDRICRFKLSDLVRVDFVFPYGRVAATKQGLMPEPFDRDAQYVADAGEIEEMRNTLTGLFDSRKL